MNKLKDFRIQLNLTQEELAEQSGISVRTIQRIEAGGAPKGHTLKKLAEILNVTKEELLGIAVDEDNINYTTVKLINISSLPFTLIPLLNIIVPLIIMFAIKNFQPINKQLISVQILWTVITFIVFFSAIILRNHFYIGDSIPIFALGLMMISNAVIIIRNAAEIDKKGKLYFKLNFNII